MATQFITIMLRAHYSEPRVVSADEFVTPLRINQDDPVVKVIRHGKGPRQASQIVFLEAEIEQYGAPHDPDANEHLYSDIASTFEQLAKWLNSRPIDIFETMQQSGIKLDIFIGMGIDSDQLDLYLPPSFLLACGRRNLRIEIISND